MKRPELHELFGVAGLYERWRAKDGAEPVETFTIVTTQANELVAKLHDRMPVILGARDQEAWVDPKNENTDALQRLLVPAPSVEMRAYPVSTRVNSAKNEGPDLIEPAAPQDLFA